MLNGWKILIQKNLHIKWIAVEIDFLDYIFLSEQISISHQYFAFTMNHPPAGCWLNNLRLLSAGSENWRVAV
jgi:hypothetical protein